VEIMLAKQSLKKCISSGSSPSLINYGINSCHKSFAVCGCGTNKNLSGFSSNSFFQGIQQLPTYKAWDAAENI
jgi:hypothetical protein